MNQFGSPWYNKTMKNTSSTRLAPTTARCTVLSSRIGNPRTSKDRRYVTTTTAHRFANDKYGSQDVALRQAIESASPVRW